MDDISETLGISKKTLYNEFDNKDSIVTEITEQFIRNDVHRCARISSNAKNAIEEILTMMTYVQKTLNNLNGSLLSDLKKYHPKGWAVMERHRNEYLVDLIDKNLTRGKQEGLYRENINNKILTRLKSVYIEIISESRFFPEDEFNFPELHRELMTHFLYGICTEKGHVLIDHFFNHQDTQ